MNRTIDAAPAHQCAVGSIDDGIDNLFGNVSDLQGYPRVKKRFHSSHSAPDFTHRSLQQSNKTLNAAKLNASAKILADCSGWNQERNVEQGPPGLHSLRRSAVVGRP